MHMCNPLHIRLQLMQKPKRMTNCGSYQLRSPPIECTLIENNLALIRITHVQ